jgi:glutamate synthase (NADPH) small chain
MGKLGGFMEFERKVPGYRARAERLRDFRAVELTPQQDDVREQAARCMECGTPFCHGCGCPLANVIPEFNDLVLEDRWEEALQVLLSTNDFPEFTGRLCPAPCEAACVLGINDAPVTIRQIELAIIETAFQRELIVPAPPKERRGQSVAVIGSGPAGLAAAQTLNRAGFRVTVFERASRAGGILRYGIPDFKLEKWVIDRRLELMQAEGVEFECGVDAGEDLSHRYLQNHFEAMVLAGGTGTPRDLSVPGRGLKGVHFAMDLLTQQNRLNGGEELRADEERISAAGKQVVVVGGGDTGADCVGTSNRQGAVRVTQLEILSEPPLNRSPATPWPLWPLQRRDSSSHEEGCERRWCVTTQSFEGKDDVVTRLHCAEVEWVASESGQRPVPKEKQGSAFTVEADLVLLAMGFVGPGPNRLVEKMGIELNPRGFIGRDARGMTSTPGVFVAGDMAQGPGLVVRAMEDGRRVAGFVTGYLEAFATV